MCESKGIKMLSPFIAVSCDSYKNSILPGFTRLQENQEFVDLTLAADGHLVKVHKNIIALASPYLKKMIQSVSSPDPVIFLNNVNHNLLAFLLEYIYQGEVSVPQDTLDSFLQVSEALHITGISKVKTKINKNAETSCYQPQNHAPVLITSNETCEEPVRPNNYAACITINSDSNIEVKQFAENLDVQPYSNNVEGPLYAETRSVLNIQDDYHVNDNAQLTATSMVKYQDNADFQQTNDMELDQNLNQDQHNREAVTVEIEHTDFPTVPTIQVLDASSMNSEMPLLDLAQPLNLDKEAIDALKIITQYSMSERGAVQIIVSRYIYCSHHESKGGRKRRWRCSDYRKLHCPAYIDSFDDLIVLRKGIHCHGYHDDKIYLKHKQCLIFSSAQQAIEVKDHSIVNAHRRR